MPRLHVFTSRPSASISAKQPHRQTQINSVNIKPERHQQPNVCAAPDFLHVPSRPIQPSSVTSPLNEPVQARLRGNMPTTSTNGSDYDIDSETLADMIYGYGIVDQDGSQGESSPSNFTRDCQVDAEGSNTRDFNALFGEQLREILEGVSFSSNTSFAFEMRLLLDAEKAVALAKETVRFIALENMERKSLSRRFVMNNLRFAGYNAAVCKSRWEKTTAHPAGEYEFIDVIIERSQLKNERFFVDIDFRSQFEIARPTDEYNALLQQLPTLFVGNADRLCGIIKIICNAARRSLKERGMCIPPWRKYRYMHYKWVGPYKRSTNPFGSWATHDTINEHAGRGLLQFPSSGIALKVTGWDASVVHQIEKGNRTADRNVRTKTEYAKQGIAQVECPDRLLTRGEQHRRLKKISRLATALAEAGLTPSSPRSNGT